MRMPKTRRQPFFKPDPQQGSRSATCRLPRRCPAIPPRPVSGPGTVEEVIAGNSREGAAVRSFVVRSMRADVGLQEEEPSKTRGVIVIEVGDLLEAGDLEVRWWSKTPG